MAPTPVHDQRIKYNHGNQSWLSYADRFAPWAISVLPVLI